MENRVEPQMTAKEFYEKNKTLTVNVPRPNHPEDKSGWDGVRQASQAQFIAKTVEVMPLWDVFDFAEKFAAAHAPTPAPQDIPLHMQYDKLLARAASLLTNLAQIIDEVKREWGIAWSDWDETQKQEISDWLRLFYFRNALPIVPSAPPKEICACLTPHAAHTFGGRPMQLCKGIPKPDCDGKITMASGQCLICKAYHEASAATATPSPTPEDLQPLLNNVAEHVQALSTKQQDFETWNAACAGIAKLLRTGWPFPDPKLLRLSAPAEEAEEKQ